MVPARRPRADQLRVVAQHGPERYHITGDDGLHRGLEACDGAITTNGFRELRECRPILEAVFAGENYLGVGELEYRDPHVGDRFVTKPRVHPLEAPRRPPVARL